MPRTTAEAIDTSTQRRTSSWVCTAARTMTYTPRNFQTTRAYEMSSAEIAFSRRNIQASGTTELVTAIATSVHSTAFSRTFGQVPGWYDRT